MDFPTIDLVRTGRNIALLRTERGISVRRLQELMGFSTPQAIYKWQHGDCLPSVDNLLALSRILRVTIDEIIVTEDCG